MRKSGGRRGRASNHVERQRGLSFEMLEPRLVLSVNINEIMFHPTSGDAGDEYIELFNQGALPVDLTGWKFSDGIDFTFSNGTLGAGQYLVVAADLAKFQANYPGVTNVVGGWVGQLSNSGETITLQDNLGATVDSVSYADEGDWAFREAGGGRKLVESITRSGATATVRILEHGYVNGDQIEISGADQPQYNGIFTVGGASANTPATFTITVSGSPATPATGNIVSRRLTDRGHDGWSWTQLADGVGSSLELVNPALSNGYGQNWKSSTTLHGTAGAVNSVQSTNIAPLVIDLTHAPVIPKSTEAVTVTARLIDELGAPSAATLYYRADAASPPPFTTVAMHDDGLAGDAVAGDGVWSAVIPPQADDTVVEFYVSVTDGVNTRTWPGPTDGMGTQAANALYQVDDAAYSGAQPLFKIIMTEAERAELAGMGQPNSAGRDSDAQMNGTFISVDSTGTEVRYAVGIRNRGAGSRDEPPNNIRINLNNDRLWHGTNDLNLNGRWSTEDVIGHTIFLDAGVPAQFVVPAEVQVNNANLADPLYDMFGFYSYMESEGDEYLDTHFSLDQDGNYYRGITSLRKSDFKYYGESFDLYRPYYTKETNVEQDDWSDLLALIKAFSSTFTPDAVFVNTLEQVVDVDEWLNFFAVTTLIGNEETSLATGRGDDFVLYRGVEDTRFRLIGHDLDSILGQGSEAASLSESIFRAASDTVNLPAIARFLKFPTIAPRYFEAILHQIETTFAPENLDALIDNTLGGYVDATFRQEMKTWAASRVTAVLAQIPRTLTASSTLAVQNGYPRTTSTTATLTGFAHAAQTRKVLVNGVQATWDPVLAKWTATGVALDPGINRILVQSLDETNTEFARTYIDIWRDTATIDVSGTLAAGTTHWTAAGGPYRVTANLTVPVGATLIIDPGVTVFFNAGVGLAVNGQLQAVGTDVDRIRFTRYPNVVGNWQQITFQNTTLANQISYADIEYAGSSSRNVQLTSSRVDFDHVGWRNTNARILDVTSSSLSLTNSTTPNTTDVEAIHVTGTFPPSGYALFQGNTFGKVTGGNDVIDFTGGQRPGPIVQILDNTFLGSEDDILDLDGTDAHIEGNVFMNAHLVDPLDSDTSSAISGGVAGGITSEWTIVRNYFYNLDHAVLAKEGAFATLVNNTIVNVSVAAINFDEPLRPGTVPGLGAYLDGNIIWNTPLVFENVNSDGTTTSLAVNHSILPTVAVYPGVGNSNLDPRLVNTVGVVDPRTELQLRPVLGPANGTGPNGRDMGADVPAGASISGEPVSPTPRTMATLSVGGPEIFAYKYRVNGGAWSGEVVVTNPGLASVSVPPIQLTGLTNGSYVVEVVAKNSAGVWQADAAATLSRTWTVNTAFSPAVRISEVLAANTGVVNVNGSTPDLIELVNDGASSLDLGGMAITDTAGVRKFTFAPGTMIAAGGRLVLYGDSAVTPPGVQLNFSLSQSGEGVFLYDTLANGGGLVDSVEFGRQLNNFSIARRDDGSWTLGTPTFGAANVFASLGDPGKMLVNEWFTNGSGPDFIELYNSSDLPVNLGGLHLTDDPFTQPDHFQIAPLYFVAAGGLSVFVADNDTAAGFDHLDFKLAYEHGQIGLMDAALEPIDVVTYGWQRTNQSQGRSPNGDADYQFFATPNPNINNPDGPGPAPDSALRIVELHYHPAPHAGVADEEDMEFIEVLNTGSVPVDLTGVQLTQFTTTPFVFESGDSVGPGERIVVARSRTVFQQVYGTGVNLAQEGYSGNLSNGGERVALVSASGALIQDFTYGDSGVAGWPDSPDGDGPSLEYIGPLTGTEDPTQVSPLDPFDNPVNWQASTANGGSPGTDGAALPDDADFNNDGEISGLDFLAWQRSYPIYSSATFSQGDADRNQAVNSLDLAIWETQYNTPPPLVAALAASSGSFTSDSDLAALAAMQSGFGVGGAASRDVALDEESIDAIFLEATVNTPTSSASASSSPHDEALAASTAAAAEESLEVELMAVLDDLLV